MKKNCYRCHVPTEDTQLTYRGECPDCDRRRRDEEAAESARSTNMLMGDMLNTGIPGGIDMDITTPL